MSFSIAIGQDGTQFVAELIGRSGVRSAGPTREDAIRGLRQEVERRVRQGELATLHIDSLGLPDLFGAWKDHDDLDGIVAEISRARDAERDAEFPP
jgi:hypothetical protein